MKVAALDLGTNSFLCLIAVVEKGEIKQVLSDQVEIVRLGQDVHKTKKFHPDALKRARLCLYEFKKSIDTHKPEKILAMATSAARDVSNAAELFSLGKDLGIPIEIIPGDREAEITFKGAISGLPHDKKRRAVIDIGGGSTEIVAGTHDEIFGGRSVNIGAVRLTEMFAPTQPPTEDQFRALQKHVEEKLKGLIEIILRYQVDELIAVAGTPTELVAATLGEFDPVKIEGFRFSKDALVEWIDKFKMSTSQERVDNLGISKGRADIILAGTVILEMILKGLDFQSVTVSTRGVRYGIALEIEKRFSR
jgi:exopolyphosphatase/guanosine-5'-triphosphate,3'-diphosphate pyrophosphatase